LDIDTNAFEKEGVGGQVVVGKGTTTTKLSLTDVIGVTAAHAQMWFPTTAGLQPANFPDFIVTTGTKQFTLEDGSPGSGTVSMSEGDGFLTMALEAGFAKVTPATAAATHVYASVAGDTNNTIVAQLGAADFGCKSFEIANNGGWENVNAMDTKAEGSQTAPLGVISTLKLPTVSCVLDDEIDTAGLLADAYTGANLVLSGNLYTITVTGIAQSSFQGKLQDASGVTSYSYKFTLVSGTIYNRVTIAAVT